MERLTARRPSLFEGLDLWLDEVTHERSANPDVPEYAKCHRAARIAASVRSIEQGDSHRLPFWLEPMGVRCVALFAVLVFANLPAVAFAQSLCPGIHVQILNIRNSTGTVACALFESPAGFPIEFLRSATNAMVIKIQKSQARCDFEDIPPGTYAMAVIHDENMNGKLETNWLGIPTEGYGFSNDAKGVVGAPSFSAASFPYDGRNLDLAISLHY